MYKQVISVENAEHSQTLANALILFFYNYIIMCFKSFIQCLLCYMLNKGDYSKLLP